jgi:hypothetical protein
MHGGQEGRRATAAAAAADRWRWYSDRPKRTDLVARMKQQTAGEAARAEKIAPPWLRTKKESGKEVKE